MPACALAAEDARSRLGLWPDGTCAPGEVRPGMWAEVYGAQQSVQALAAAAGVAANVLLALSARLAPRSAARQEEAPEVVA